MEKNIKMNIKCCNSPLNRMNNIFLLHMKNLNNFVCFLKYSSTSSLNIIKYYSETITKGIEYQCISLNPEMLIRKSNEII